MQMYGGGDQVEHDLVLADNELVMLGAGDMC